MPQIDGREESAATPHLPVCLGSQAGFSERSEREASAVAALNHLNNLPTPRRCSEPSGIDLIHGSLVGRWTL